MNFILLFWNCDSMSPFQTFSTIHWTFFREHYFRFFFFYILFHSFHFIVLYFIVYFMLFYSISYNRFSLCGSCDEEWRKVWRWVLREWKENKAQRPSGERHLLHRWLHCTSYIIYIYIAASQDSEFAVLLNSPILFLW